MMWQRHTVVTNRENVHLHSLIIVHLLTADRKMRTVYDEKSYRTKVLCLHDGKSIARRSHLNGLDEVLFLLNFLGHPFNVLRTYTRSHSLQIRVCLPKLQSDEQLHMLVDRVIVTEQWENPTSNEECGTEAFIQCFMGFDRCAKLKDHCRVLNLWS